MWSVLVWFAGSKIGRLILGIGIIAFFIFSFRVWLAWHDASLVKQATAQMVTKFERDAIAAQLAKERRDAAAAAQSLEEHRKRLDAALKSEDAAAERREAEIADYEKRLREAGRACLLDADDIKWLRRKH
ncbi:hypothetical protein [Rhizobium sp. NLR22b]|uniref:hypothetical protein n=1 Tax=Rhizobium sp. NLR22b TaxID=2731115 RepID=UPI001C83B07C|nr:hypothetical protein [Rhizobium sp. NLR22b]MBX5238613.1 hypothetical protein [Rhizobium sp. NLR22b]